MTNTIPGWNDEAELATRVNGLVVVVTHQCEVLDVYVARDMADVYETFQSPMGEARVYTPDGVLQQLLEV